MGVETVSLIIAAFVNGSFGIAALMRNFRSRLCLSFGALAFFLCAHDALCVLDTFKYAGTTLNTARFHICLVLAIGPASLWFLSEAVPGFRTRLARIQWGYLLSLLMIGPVLYFAAYRRLEPVVFTSVHLVLLFPALVWGSILNAGYRATQLTRERLRLRYAFWGGSLVLLFYVTDVLHFTGMHVAPLGTLARVLFLVFMFLTFIQKELVTAEEVVAKLALFGGIALMLSTIYSLLVSWVGDQPGLFFFNTLIASFVSIVLFDPMRKFTARFTRKLFLQKNAQLEDELNLLSQELMGLVEPKDMSRRIATALKRGIGVEAAALYLLERDGLSYVCVDRGEKNRFQRELESSNPLVEYMTLRRGRPFVLETIENDRESFHSAQPRRFCQNTLENMRAVGADLIIPFAQESRVAGFFAVVTGERIVLSNEQLRLLIPVSRQIAFLLRNAETFTLLREREKLAALGEMAAGLAHEIKNPLGAIKGAAQLLKGEAGTPTPGGASSEFLSIILDETDRLSKVVTDFLDYAKPRRNNPMPSCDPLRVIEHTAALILRESKVDLEILSEKEGISIEADPEALKQVLLNLFLNAVQAMAGTTDKPRLRVRINEVRPKKFLSIAESLPLYKVLEGWEQTRTQSPRPYLEIEVTDNGPGVAQADMSRIFVPFYTTKPKGTGLGLSISQRLVEGMGGTIHVKANRPGGTSFTIHLPVWREEGKDAGEWRKGNQSAENRETVS